MSMFQPILAGEMRDNIRKRVLMQTTIISVGGPQRAYVRDLSPSGARIICEHRLEEGCDIIFKRGDMFVAARIAWVTSEEAGVQFYRELDSAALALGSHV